MVQKVLLAVPTSGIARHANFYDYLRAVTKPPVAGLMCVHGQSPARNRNLAIEQAIAQDFTHVWFLDDDVVPPMDALDKLLAHDVDMVSGYYLMRSYPHQPIAFTKTESDGRSQHLYPEHNQTGLVEITTGGLGCCLVKTDVFKAMLPDCKLTVKDCHDWIRLGEMVSDHWCDDLGFFMRARNLGFKLYVDLSVQVGHMVTVTIFPRHENGKHMIHYDSNGSKAVAFVAPVHSELIGA